MLAVTPRLPALSLLVFAACHGGGGTSTPPTLGLTSSLPGAGAIAEPDTTVQVVFDRDADPATLTAAAFTVADFSGPLAGTAAYDAGARRWTWTPAQPLPRGAQLTVQLGAGVHGSAGEQLSTSSWSFHVRAGIPAAPVELDANLGSSGDDGVFAAMKGDGGGVVALRGSSWSVQPTTVSPLLPLAGSVRGMHADASGEVAVLTVSGTGTGVGVDVCRQVGTGWSCGAVTATGTAFITDAQLVGNEAGDLLVYLRTIETTSPTHGTVELFASRAATPTTWASVQQLVTSTTTLAPWRFALDGLGHAGVLWQDGTLRVDVHDLANGATDSYPLAPGPYATMFTLAAARDGGLRALWNQPSLGNYERRRAPGATGFLQEAPVSSPAHYTSQWRASASGAIAGWTGTTAFRSETTGQWSTATLPSTPLAVAMSPRGEAVFLHFSLPDAWFLVRWRAGEAPDAPLPIATATSAFNALRDGALAVDASGVVLAALSVDATGPLLAVRVE